MLAPGIYVGEEQIEVPHVHVPISAIITARSRRLLLEHMRAAAKLGRIYYCDTDSVICDAELPTSPELGGLKLEPYQIEKGVFVGAKLYAIKLREEVKGKMELTKAKGFSRIVGEGGDAQPLTYESFLDISEGRTATINRMMRIRELIRKEGIDYLPKDVTFEKRLNLDVRPKRARLPDGDSRPWRVDELQEE